MKIFLMQNAQLGHAKTFLLQPIMAVATQQQECELIDNIEDSELVVVVETNYHLTQD